MFINENEKLEIGLTYRFNYQIKPPLISLKPFDTLRQELADNIKYELETSGFKQVSTYVYTNEIHAIGVYSPSGNNQTSSYLENNRNIQAFPIILVGAIVIAISALIIALAFSIVGHTIEKMNSLPPNVNFIGLIIVVIIILGFVFFYKRK